MSRFIRSLRSALLEMWGNCKEPLLLATGMISAWVVLTALGWMASLNPALAVVLMAGGFVLFLVWKFFCVVRKHYRNTP